MIIHNQTTHVDGKEINCDSHLTGTPIHIIRTNNIFINFISEHGKYYTVMFDHQVLLQQDLADELAKEGITISYKAISNWERNLAEPSVTIFYKVCRILGITNMYEAYFGVNPADPFSSLTDEGREKAMDYINLLHASGMYEKQTAKIIPFRSIDIFENAVSAGTGNFLVDGPKETVCIDESILP